MHSQDKTIIEARGDWGENSTGLALSLQELTSKFDPRNNIKNSWHESPHKSPGLHTRAHRPGSYTRGQSGPRNHREDTIHMVNSFKPVQQPQIASPSLDFMLGPIALATLQEDKQILGTPDKTLPIAHKVPLVCPTI